MATQKEKQQTLAAVLQGLALKRTLSSARRNFIGICFEGKQNTQPKFRSQKQSFAKILSRSSALKFDRVSCICRLATAHTSQDCCRASCWRPGLSIVRKHWLPRGTLRCWTIESLPLGTLRWGGSWYCASSIIMTEIHRRARQLHTVSPTQILQLGDATHPMSQTCRKTVSGRFVGYQGYRTPQCVASTGFQKVHLAAGQ